MKFVLPLSENMILVKPDFLSVELKRKFFFLFIELFY